MTVKFEDNFEFKLYGEVIKCGSPNIMGYNPLNKKDFEDKFRINRVICSNSLSPNTISRAENLQNNKSVAIKEIRKEKLSKSYLHEFAKNEIAIHHSLSKLSNNIVNVIDYFEDETTYTIAMEYCEEPNYFEEILENVIFLIYKNFFDYVTYCQKYNPITNERTLKAYALDILNGLNDIHKNNIIHCDIKPENFLLFKNNLDLTNGDDYQEDSFSADSFDATENIKITDFGLSHIIPLGSSKTLMKFKSGSFYYMAPEIKNVIFFLRIK